MLKKIIGLIVLTLICCGCLLYTNLDSTQKVAEDPVISKDLFQKVWTYQNDQGNAQTIFLDKSKNRIVFVLYEGGFSVLDKKECIALCQYQPEINSGNSKYRPKIVKTQDDIIFTANDGGNNIFTYDLNDCEALAEIQLNDLSYICDYTVGAGDGKVFVLTYTGAAAFDSFTGGVVWRIMNDAIASQRTCGLLKAFGNYLFIEGKGEIYSVNHETGINLFKMINSTDGIYIRRGYMGVEDFFLVRGDSVDNIQDQFVVVLSAKTGEILSKTRIPDDEYFGFAPIQVVEGRKLLYGYRFPSGDDEPGYCNMYEILETEVRLLWENKGLCGDGVFLGDWIVAKRYPELTDDSKYSSTYYFLDVFTGEIQKTQKFNMRDVIKLYSDGENIYFLQDHSLVAYEIKK